MNRRYSPDIEECIRAVERLTQLFRLERLVYLGTTAFALGLLFAVAFILIRDRKAETPELVMLFGSSGLVTFTAGRLLLMWNQALRLNHNGSSPGSAGEAAKV